MKLWTQCPLMNIDYVKWRLAFLRSIGSVAAISARKTAVDIN